MWFLYYRHLNQVLYQERSHYSGVPQGPSIGYLRWKPFRFGLKGLGFWFWALGLKGLGLTGLGV